MANPVGFEGANVVFQAPRGVPQEECGDLPVFRDSDQIISCWRLTADEIEEVKRTGVVWLSVIGSGTPPVKVSGDALVQIAGRPAVAEPFFPPAKRTG